MHELPSRERTRIRAAFTKGKGRPRAIALAPVPTIDAADYHRVIDEARHMHIESDQVVVSQANEPDLAARLQLIEVSLARETAGLLFDRQRAEKEGRDGLQISGRRIDGMLKLADLVLERQRLGLRGDNPKHLEIVTDLFIEVVRRVASELPSEVAERLMSAFVSAIRPTTSFPG